MILLRTGDYRNDYKNRNKWSRYFFNRGYAKNSKKNCLDELSLHITSLNSLNSNLTSASKAAQSISVPSDLSSNAQSVSDGLSSASASIEEINKLYQNLGKSLSQVNSATDALDIPEGIGEELEKMKNTIKELNAKYEAMLGAMNK